MYNSRVVIPENGNSRGIIHRHVINLGAGGVFEATLNLNSTQLFSCRQQAILATSRKEYFYQKIYDI